MRWQHTHTQVHDRRHTHIITAVIAVAEAMCVCTNARPFGRVCVCLNVNRLNVVDAAKFACMVIILYYRKHKTTISIRSIPFSRWRFYHHHNFTQLTYMQTQEQLQYVCSVCSVYVE